MGEHITDERDGAPPKVVTFRLPVSMVADLDALLQRMNGGGRGVTTSRGWMTRQDVGRGAMERGLRALRDEMGDAPAGSDPGAIAAGAAEVAALRAEVERLRAERQSIGADAWTCVDTAAGALLDAIARAERAEAEVKRLRARRAVRCKKCSGWSHEIAAGECWVCGGSGAVMVDEEEVGDA